MKLKAIILSVIILIGDLAYAQKKVGTTAAPFLGISVGPRATAMGGAFTAVSDDATALYWNPGGLARANKSQLILSHTNWLIETDFTWVGFVLNLDGTNAIGLSITQLNYGEEEVTSVVQPEGTGERWGASDFAATISYSRNLTDRFSIGGSVKYIQQKIWHESASGFALDVGLLFITQFNEMKLGMSISNFGTDMRLDGKDLLHKIDLDPEAQGHNETIMGKLKTDSFPLPLFFRVGVAMDLVRTPPNRLTLAIDALRPSDNSETLNIGVEYVWNELLFIRGGYKSLFREDSEEGLTTGVGLRCDLGNLGVITIDYTYVDFGLFEGIQMMALGISF